VHGFADAGGGQADAVLVVFDLSGYADTHGGLRGLVKAVMLRASPPQMRAIQPLAIP
jgi:hypothetical protein